MIGKKKVTEWIALIQGKDDALVSRLESIYGGDRSLIDDRLATFLKLAREFKRIHGNNREVGFVRAPGRLNTLGMHIDHRGGFVNPIALNREIALGYAGREDDRITVQDTDPAYGKRSFQLSTELPRETISTVSEWLSWTQKETDRRKQAGTNHDWINKLKAIPVYLQVMFPDRKLTGFEAVLDSNIPPRVGLSSSSSVVVAVLEIMLDLNRISLTDDQFVNYCGTGEWYVGTRGGSGDHAAIKFGRSGMMTHMRTIPRLEITSHLPFPEGYRLVVFDSGIEADKTGPARQKFNEKTATYEIGEIYIREYLEEHHGTVFAQRVALRDYLRKGEKRFYLADVVECLDEAQIHELLRHLPERIDRQSLLEQLPGYAELLKEQFATHVEPDGGYRVQSVLTYGIAETERSRILVNVMAESDIERFGQLMNASHDGDRVSFRSPEMENKKRSVSARGPLCLQPGGYDCSIPEIDEMVDIALEAGAKGAQISGAGLGGSMMALVKAEDVDHVIDRMKTAYYTPRQVKANFFVANAVEGACFL